MKGSKRLITVDHGVTIEVNGSNLICDPAPMVKYSKYNMELHDILTIQNHKGPQARELFFSKPVIYPVKYKYRKVYVLWSEQLGKFVLFNWNGFGMSMHEQDMMKLDPSIKKITYISGWDSDRLSEIISFEDLVGLFSQIDGDATKEIFILKNRYAMDKHTIMRVVGLWLNKELERLTASKKIDEMLGANLLEGIE